MSSFKSLEIPAIPLGGTNLIEASAGTGKTYTISHLYLRLLLEKQYDVRSILVVTFTEAATKELIERIRSKLSEVYEILETNSPVKDSVIARILENCLKKQSRGAIKTTLRKAIIRFDEASIHTIHGFCKRILSDYSFETSVLFDAELLTDQRRIVQEITEDFQRITFSEGSVLLSDIAKSAGLDSTGWIRLAFQLLALPAARLVPDSVPDIVDTMNILLEKVTREWKALSTDIKNILLDDDGLKRDQNTYRKDKLESYFKSLDQLTANDIPSGLLKSISMLSADTLKASLKKNKTAPNHEFFGLCRQINSLIPDVIIRLKHSFAEYLKQELDLRKKQANIHTFDDLIATVCNALKSKELGPRLRALVREKYRVALVDEFQDTDSIQYEIFDRIFSDHDGLFMIGDPKQSIYSFRGADLFTYFKAARSVPEEKGFTLDTNWRSENGLIDAVNALFSEMENPFVLGGEIGYQNSLVSEESKGNRSKLKIENDSRNNLIFWNLENENPGKLGQPLNKDDAARQAIEDTTREISWILEQANNGSATIGGERIKPSDIAILVLRNKDARDLKRSLIRLNIPAVMTKSGNVFHTHEAREIQKIMKAVAAPMQSTGLNSALASDVIGLEGSQILELLEINAKRVNYEEHIALFSNYREIWAGKGFMSMFRKLMADYEVRQKLLRLPGGERKLTNILHLAELIHAKEMKDKPGINSMLSWLEQQRQSEEQQEEHELRLERDDEAVQISTVFKSKGLQYPIVFCPFMWQRSAVTAGDTVSYHLNNELLLDLGSEEQLLVGREKAQQEHLADLMRLLYVAMTRAQNRCYVVCGRIGKSSVNGLDYIFSGGISRDKLLTHELMMRISKLDGNQYLEMVRQCLEEKPITLQLSGENPLQAFSYHPQIIQQSKELQCRDYPAKNRWTKEWGIASYSKITAGGLPFHQDDLLLADEGVDPAVKVADSDDETFFAFPGGRVAGTCIHSVFEKIDFNKLTNESLESAIRQSLVKFGLTDQESEGDQASSNIVRMEKMIRRVLSSPLVAGNKTIFLNQIETQNKLVELEFHFAMSRLTPKSLQNLVSGSISLRDRLELLNFMPINGYMHGFIDLVFKVGERFYIIDWKSNNLGSSYRNYQADKLAATMTEHLYDLQYYIYTVALNLYLEKRLPDYSYKKHFGGVFYLFVRGMHPELPGNGVFYDLPSEQLISNLRQLVRIT